MKMTQLAPEFLKALPILKQIEQAGFEAYFVGGSVRDWILGLPIHDIDIATSAYPEEIKQIFKKTVDTGIQHGTVMILDHGIGYEVTTFRTETGYQDYRRPDKVTFVRSLKEDLKRRDFTINALAMQSDGVIIDLFDGLKDLKAKQITAVGNPQERFHEDALRMMRAVRFESQLGFSLTPATKQAITNNAQLLSKIAIERIQVELIKLLLGQSYQNGLKTFIMTKLYQYCPGLNENEAALTKLCHLPVTKLPDEPTAWLLLSYLLTYQPETVAPFMKSWKNPNDILRQVKLGLALLPKILDQTANDWDLYQTGQQVLTQVLSVAKILDTTLEVTSWQERYAQLPIFDKQELVVNGQKIMQQFSISPGPKLGDILLTAEKAVVLKKVANDKDKIYQYIKDNCF